MGETLAAKAQFSRVLHPVTERTQVGGGRNIWELPQNECRIGSGDKIHIWSSSSSLVSSLILLYSHYILMIAIVILSH